MGYPCPSLVECLIVFAILFIAGSLWVLHRSYGGNPWYPVTLMIRNDPPYFDMYKP
jgi:hypothetical protein